MQEFKVALSIERAAEAAGIAVNDIVMLQDHGIAANDIEKLKLGGYHTIISVRKQFIYGRTT